MKSEKVFENIVNCNEMPFVPLGWSVLPKSEQLQNRVKGQYKLDFTRTKLFLVKKQKKGGIEGNELRKKMIKKGVLPANVLEYLLNNQNLIPEEFKGKCIFFWGTIYIDLSGRLCTRYLHWNGIKWDWGSIWLNVGWHDDSPSIVIV